AVRWAAGVGGLLLAAGLGFAVWRWTAGVTPSGKGSSSAQNTSPTNDRTQILSPEEARKYADQDGERTVQLAVARVGKYGGFVFLNSEKDHRDKKNFAVVILPEAQEEFLKLGVDDFKDRYGRKTVRVTGKVTLFKRDGQERPQIKVSKPSQIEIVQK